MAEKLHFIHLSTLTNRKKFTPISVILVFDFLPKEASISNLNSFALKLIRTLLNIPIYFVDQGITKDSDIFVFSANGLRGINGNVFAVIKGWSKHSKAKKVEGFVISLKNEHFEGLTTIHPLTFNGVKILLKAGTVVISHGPGDLFYKSLVKNKKRKIINLWHGIPLKKINSWNNWESTVLITASETERSLMSKMTGTPKEKIAITGYPRTDDLINKPDELKKGALHKLDRETSKARWVLYAPTYRKVKNSQAYLHRLPDFSASELKNLLEKYNAYLLIRSHPNDPIKNFPQSERVIFAEQKTLPDIEPLYCLSDVLVTDYSSSIFDYSLLGKPMIGLAADLEYYKKDPGLLFDYDNFFPGPVVKNWTGLKNSLDTILAGSDNHEEKRKRFSERFNKFKDGEGAERVLELICK